MKLFNKYSKSLSSPQEKTRHVVYEMKVLGIIILFVSLLEFTVFKIVQPQVLRFSRFKTLRRNFSFLIIMMSLTQKLLINCVKKKKMNFGMEAFSVLVRGFCANIQTDGILL
jgi:hypothetical protein